jgi:hypothetical protein
MPFARSASAAVAFVGTLLLLGAARPSPVDAEAAQKYFGCPTGYTFQVSGSNARCYLAGTQSTANIICGIGMVYAVDQFSGYRDACQNKLSSIVGNYTCPSGYSSNARPGPDICVKSNPPSIIAPTVEKSI